MSQVLLLVLYTPMAQNSTMAGYSQRYGTLSNLIQMPISGWFSTISMALPIHIEAIRPQNSSGLLLMTCGPGWMLWMVMAPTISAITALGGMPNVSSGMNEVCEAALLAASGAATPRILPFPKGTSPGCSLVFFSTV